MALLKLSLLISHWSKAASPTWVWQAAPTRKEQVFMGATKVTNLTEDRSGQLNERSKVSLGGETPCFSPLRSLHTPGYAQGYLQFREPS